MPLYVLRCEEHGEAKTPFEEEVYLPLWNSPNPPCECGAARERVWRGRQYHAELHGWPMTTRMLDGNLRTFNNLKEWEKAVDSHGLRIRDDASWLDEDPQMGKWNWRERRYEHGSSHAIRGGKGSWY